MKSILCLVFGLLSFQAHALDCVAEAADEVLTVAATKIGVNKSELKIRYVGGESFDGDVDSGDIYMDHSGEYFDVFLINDDPMKSSALQMYATGIYIYSNLVTGETVECDTYLLEPVDFSKWAEIYDLYL